MNLICTTIDIYEQHPFLYCLRCEKDWISTVCKIRMLDTGEVRVCPVCNACGTPEGELGVEDHD